jgi:hypothetical protein
MPQRSSRRHTPQPNRLSWLDDDVEPGAQAPGPSWRTRLRRHLRRAQDPGSSWRASVRRYLWLDDFRPTSASQAGRSPWGSPGSRRRVPVASVRSMLATVAAGVAIALIILYSRAA